MAKIKAELLMAVQVVNNVIAPLIHYGQVTLKYNISTLITFIEPDL